MADSDKPDYQSLAYQRMSPAWTIVNDVIGGTAHMRGQAATYLPQFPAEPDTSYNQRLKTTTLYGAYEETLEAVVGMVFRKEPQLADDATETDGDIRPVPPNIVEDMESVDAAGTHWTLFAREVLRSAVHLGHTFIVVDAPPPLRAEDGATLADEADRRAYWCHRKADEAVNWHSSVIDGQTVLDLITFKECTVERVGRFGEAEVTRYRVWELVPEVQDGEFIGWRARWELWRQVSESSATSEPTFALEASGATNLDRIPVVVIYGKKTNYLESKPALLNLAYLNIKHWQKQSDLDSFISVTVPFIWGVKFKDDGDLVAIGRNTVLECEEGGSINYCEPTGAGLEAMRTNLLDNERQMMALGLNFVVDESGDGNKVDETATGRVLQAARRSSKLSQVVSSLHDGLEAALQFHAQYYGLEDGGSVVMGSSADDLALSPGVLQILNTMVADGNLTRLSFLRLLEKTGLLPDGTIASKEDAELAKQDELALEDTQDTLAGGAQGENNKGGDINTPAPVP